MTKTVQLKIEERPVVDSEVGQGGACPLGCPYGGKNTMKHFLGTVPFYWTKCGKVPNDFLRAGAPLHTVQCHFYCFRSCPSNILSVKDRGCSRIMRIVVVTMKTCSLSNQLYQDMSEKYCSCNFIYPYLTKTLTDYMHTWPCQKRFWSGLVS